MSDDELEELLWSYLDLANHAPNSPEEEAHDNAYESVRKVVEHDPTTALRLVEVVLRSPLSNDDEEFFAADALEDLLDAHGPLVVERLIAWMDRDRMRRMLAVVYHYDIDADVSQQINAALVRHGLPPWTGSVGRQQPHRPPS
jgi:hypothetical protein